MIEAFLAADQRQFRRENVAAAFIHLTLAGAAGAFAAAGAGNQDVVIEQRGQQGFVGGRRDGFIVIVIDDDATVPLDHHLGFHEQKCPHQDEDYR